MAAISDTDVLGYIRELMRIRQEYLMQDTNTSSLEVELVQIAEGSIGLMVSFIESMPHAKKLWDYNGMNELVLAAIANPGGVQLPGNYTVERWAEVKAVFDAFKAWLETAQIEIIPGVAYTPEHILYRRTPPPAFPTP